MLRKLTFVVMGTILASASLVLTSPTAFAVSYDGDLRIRGPVNTALTQGPFVSQSASIGSTVAYTFDVKNTGTTIAQFRFHIANMSASKMKLFDNNVDVTALAVDEDGYITRAISPGRSVSLIGRVFVAPGTVDWTHVTDVLLFATDGEILDTVSAITEEAAPASGGTGYDMKVANGGQKPVGHSQTSQVMTAGTLSNTGTATFTVTLKNNSTRNGQIFFWIQEAGPCANFAISVRQGFTNVTAAALTGAHHTNTLRPGNSVTLSVSVKTSGPNPCPYNYWTISSGPLPQPTEQYSHVLTNRAG